MFRYIISFVIASAGSSALAEVPKVMTDIPPVYGLVAKVMGDLGTPGLLVEPGLDGHDFQLRPSQAKSLSEADILIWVGPEMTPWLDRAASGLAAEASQLHLLDQQGTFQLSYAEEEGHDHTDHDGHDHTGTDPHAWLDPNNAIVWTRSIAKILAEKDPTNATTYFANAESAVTAIAELDRSLTAQLQPIKDKPFLVYHDAYQYLRHRYGLSVVGAISLGDATSPGAAHLLELRAENDKHQVVCIFPEANHDAALIEPIIEGTSIKVGKPLDPEGASLPVSANMWEDVLKNLALTLQDCLK